MTSKERYKIYQSFFHHMALMVDLQKHSEISTCLKIINDWSYAHRVGNGQNSDYEQQKIIDRQIKKMKVVCGYE